MSKIIERIDITIDIPESYLEFVKNLEKSDVEAYFVGGCVRDAMLNIEYHDFDLFCLCGKEYFLSKNKDYEVVVDFERVLIVCDESTGNYYTMSFAENFEEDFSSRDLTINSIYYDWTCKKVFGFQESFEDLENMILRPINNEVFLQDDLKKLRAIRFNCKLEDSIIISDQVCFEYEIDLESINTKFKAYRLRNEFFKHKVGNLGRYGLINKIIKKLMEFDVNV
ncbi:hypothetical protein G9F71_016365 [Clostridium sp. FP2]|uniref:CCA tRNA nucleotidyltransferase n=1 Tax=Clostridium sp. FP2 TaxID=2724481 RepID=UPI0013E9523A|nr:CCA tRNA nucleotidyltransferase [Clostridium sp. FP2]MBZ9624426.1 hypothetical protein [Clostridium sp. FP2]